MKAKRLIISSLVAVLVAVAVVITGPAKVWAVAEDRYADFQIFTKVLNLVQQYYVDEVDTKKLIYGGIRGMLHELDPHTNFLPPEMFKEFESETSGEFGGIGIEITVQDGILTVIAPIEDTPAWKAGVKAGDKVVEINGESTKGFSLVEAAQKMRGKKGSAVKMKLFRDGMDTPQEFSITRGTVKVKSVKYTDLDDGLAYIRLTSFIETSSDEMEKAIKKHISEHKEVKGMILDLRRNPGGLLDQAIKISDLFLAKGIIVSTIGRNKKDKEVVYAKEPGTLPDFPIIVLVNEYSASAAEILAGALQDNKRAVIMGKRTFGKGSVQSVVKLGDGSALKLTVARYYTPSGISIQAEGIKPDIVLDELDPEALDKAVVKRESKREADISGHLIGDRENKSSIEQKKEKDEEESMTYWWSKATTKKDKDLSPKEKLLSRDFQLSQAFNHLKAWQVMRRFNTPDAEAPSTPTPKLPEEKKKEKSAQLDPAKYPFALDLDARQSAVL